MNRITLTKFCLIVILMSFQHLSNAQFMDNFDDGDLSNPAWMGDVQNFIVNEDLQLQLNAPEAGISFIYSNVNFPDSLRWNCYFKMDFNPSNSNKSTIYIAIDNDDYTVANGYSLDFGENGSDDNIKFNQLVEGEPFLIAEGPLGYIATDPVELNISLEKNSSDQWSLSVFDLNTNTNSIQFETDFNDETISDNSIFGFYCAYTASRTDAFFLDDIWIEEILPDTESPTVLNVQLIGNNTINVSYSESMDENTILDLGNYFIAGLGNPSDVQLDQTVPNQVILTFDPSLNDGTEYSLDISGVQDISSNIIEPISFPIVVLSSPQVGDIIINEILFNPKESGSDYIELYNNSNKYLSLDNIYIANTIKDDQTLLETNRTLLPGEYLLITEDFAWTQDYFNLFNTSTLIENNLPSFDNASGNFSVLYEDEINQEIVTLDEVNYFEEWHSPLTFDEDGMSLERIDFNGLSNDESNWTTPFGLFLSGTPGYENSTTSFDPSELPSPKDIVINEILFNPTTNGFDYVEIYNNSDKTFQLNSLALYNEQNGDLDPFIFPIEFSPNTYKVATLNTIWLSENYTIEDEDAVVGNLIPRFNDDQGHVAIVGFNLDKTMFIIDSLTYSEDWHFEVVNDVEGVSLERLAFDGESSSASNWTSASQNSGFGTPGYKNSQSFTPTMAEEVISLQSKTFSPNGDADGDQLIILSNTDQPGYLATIEVFNVAGQRIRKLADNLLLGDGSFITWDGLNDAGQKAPIGIYILRYKLFNVNGSTLSGKMTCILADFLE